MNVPMRHPYSPSCRNTRLPEEPLAESQRNPAYLQAEPDGLPEEATAEAPVA